MSRHIPLFSALLLGLVACSGSSSSEDTFFTVRSTTRAVSASTPVAVSERYVAFLADEASTAGGSFLNGDTDVSDSVATVVDVISLEETNLGVAALHLAFAGTELFVAVDEALDSMDWDDDGMMNSGEISLLRWNPGLSDPVFVASLAVSEGPSLVRVGDRVFFAEEIVGSPGTGMTNLRVIDGTDPGTVIEIGTTSGVAGGLRPQLLGEDEGLIFLGLDETLEGANLNGDADSADEYVLALLHGRFSGGRVHNTRLAVADADAPFRAHFFGSGSSNWLVAFLVNELAQGAPTGLNDPNLFTPTWQPTQCLGIDDTDLDDDVLHFLYFGPWSSDAVTNPPVNTGLAGVGRVVALSSAMGDFVGTVSRELDDGGCDLNFDGDTDDHVARWVSTDTPILPLGDQDQDLIALANGVPGGTSGFAVLQDRFVILASESADQTDYDGVTSTDFNLIGWVEPTGGGFTFNHGAGSPFYGGATWMTETPDHARLLLAAPEAIDGVNLNPAGGDTDTNDSVPSFSDFNGDRFVYSIARAGLAAANAGMVVADNIGFYRVDESADGRDWNGDGMLNDFVLFRTTFSTGSSTFMGPLNNLSGRPAIFIDPAAENSIAGALLAQEALGGMDLNGDGDAADFVLRYFRM